MRGWFANVKAGYLPLAIGASVLVIPWLFLSWNLTIGQLVTVLHSQNRPIIAGVVEEAAPDLSLNAVSTGTYQQWIARRVGRLSPVFRPAVRWKNQLYYSLMGTSGTDRVVVGRQRQLLELPYLVEYLQPRP